MSDRNDKHSGMSRREFLQSTGLTTLALSTAAGALAGGSGLAAAAESSAESSGSAPVGPYNIVFILTDQERYMSKSQLPPGLQLGGRERLQRRGVTFTNHQISSAVCSSSRSVIYTGQHIQHTRVFDNLNFPWANDLSTEIPTLGDMLGEAGYYAAYKGKWHMSKDMDTHDSLALYPRKG